MRTPVIFSFSPRSLARPLLWLCAGAAVAPALASSLAPASSQALVGNWVLFPDGRRGEGCVLSLAPDNRASSHDPHCGAAWLSHPIAAWASKPDGIALSRGDLHTLLMLTPVGGGHFRGRTRQGLVLWLERAD
ncbi:protease inhibitor Inh/omp19 family protein [Pseudomonas sp. RIT-PI-S]|uniref:protease inhibitor Inh/omp19 family protein n=1 Tax=Pseudomonas sp. RIT-PI-S TaxID=3035295 RepID=UPI0021DB7717|nr:protease inhibitor Inh/omp19 family protein [Pseudomonas sp. RIT-PI-S]